MNVIIDREPDLAPQTVAGFLLAARSHLERLGLPHPQVSHILEATSATRSRSYEIRDEFHEALKGWTRRPGRPLSQPKTDGPAQSPSLSLAQAFLDFVMEHPGCVSLSRERRHYADIVRLKVLELREEYESLDLGSFAQAIRIPQGTLEDWFRPGQSRDVSSSLAGNDRASTHEVKNVKIETVLEAWRRWQGDFSAFCDHIQKHHRIDWGRSFIASILSQHGERTIRPRKKRRDDSEALRSSFKTFFPGAQWVGDGAQVPVTVDQNAFHYNVEFMVDAFSDAFVGTSIRDTEDSTAVTEAFEQAVITTGEHPLALLLDNRPSNHTQDVDDTLQETLRIRSTQGRPENKAHVEGGIGLFSQQVPPLHVTTEDPRELGRQILGLVVDTFTHSINHRPRRDHDGKTRYELYQQPVTEEDRARAQEALNERLRKQELARKTREARLDPLRRNLLDETFDRLHLIDPERYLRNHIASYPIDDIIDAIAIYDAKNQRGTLPPSADARYLLGIVRNVHHLHESDLITEALIRLRLDAQDKLLQPLQRELAEIQNLDLKSSLNTLVDRALDAGRTLDRFFWLTSIVDLIASSTEHQRSGHYRHVARRIHAKFHASRQVRCAAERFILRRLWPLA